MQIERNDPMNNRPYPALVNAAESISQGELCLAPELPILAALDAALLAAATLLEFNHPSVIEGISECQNMGVGPEEHLAESICILATALRSNLAAYYAAIQESCDDCTSQQEISF
jgi:hypothetical protein